MRRFSFMAIFLLALAPEAIAAVTDGIITKDKYFDALKPYVEKDFVLNDYLEFSVFDLSEIKFLDEAGDANLQGVYSETQIHKKMSGQTEIKEILPEVPKYFYRALKKEILKQKVPVTLFPTDSPADTKPIQLYVKIKLIHLKATITEKDAVSQPVLMRVYGELKEKKTGLTLAKFYDSTQSRFILGTEGAKIAFQDMSQELMTDLAGFLRTKY
jgi:hypothetical protein